ncbi:Low temperature requirement protein LtrA [Micromonospora rhizosphaerae]|uniref:Low temperature requirement protein LtrA n=1 Tax=Micromonospora rhizosphaerae TaxID=568872 RepID=A0A1C6T9V8_9ACTN|nr:low temperature requirement protein A [Micromonospora rhizosphaerae]SCL38427.1 Low temperature requirement protein LtrA [Micromonospora rhizosphaerae]
MRRVRAGGAPSPGRLAARFALPAPSRPRGKAGQRHATWLELFFDVIFVFALGAVVDRLGDEPVPRPSAVLTVCGLFVVLQWAWVGQVFYDTRYDPDDTPHRLLVLVALVGAGALTLGVREAPEGVLLPAGYLLVRGVLLLLYLRARPTGAPARQVTGIYLVGFGIGWVIWLASLAVPASARPAFWIAGMAVELATPWVGLRRLNRSPVDVVHLPERIGQFAIIVLGSTLANLLTAVPAHPTPGIIGSAAVAFAVPASVWWVYTTFVNTGLAMARLRGGQAYTYVHIAMNAGLLLLGWSLGQLVRQIEADAPTTPTALRAVLAATLLTWMLCGLGLSWLAVQRPGVRRLAITGYGIASVTAIAVAVARPLPLLVLLAIALVGYAVLLTRHLTALARAR